MIMTRRDAVASFTLFAELIASSRDAEAQTPPQPAAAPRPPVFKQDLPDLTMNDWEVTVSHVDYPPGRVGAVHHHAGFVLAYVLEGAVIAKIWDRARKKPTVWDRCFTSSPVQLTKYQRTRARRNPRSCSR